MSKTIERKAVIVLEKCPDQIEVWGSLTRACKAHPEFNYSKISRVKLPYTYQGWTFKRVPFNGLC